MNDVCSRNNLTNKNVKGIGITNQRETTIAFDRTTGIHYHNAIVWCDVRTSEIVAQMKKKNNDNADAYRPICGLPINTYFSS